MARTKQTCRKPPSTNQITTEQLLSGTAVEKQTKKPVPRKKPGSIDTVPGLTYPTSSWIERAKKEELDYLKDKYFFCDEWKLICPSANSSVVDPPEGCVGVYRESFEYGLRFPLHSVISSILQGYDITLAQMVPTSWATVCCFIATCEAKKLVCNLNVFRALHSLSGTKSIGWFSFTNRNRTITMPERRDAPKNWKREFFFVRSPTGKFGHRRDLGSANRGLNCEPSHLGEDEKKTVDYFRYQLDSGEKSYSWRHSLSLLQDEMFLCAVGLSRKLDRSTAMKSIDMSAVLAMRATGSQRNEKKKQKSSKVQLPQVDTDASVEPRSIEVIEEDTPPLSVTPLQQINNNVEHGTRPSTKSRKRKLAVVDDPNEHAIITTGTTHPLDDVESSKETMEKKKFSLPTSFLGAELNVQRQMTYNLREFLGRPKDQDHLQALGFNQLERTRKCYTELGVRLFESLNYAERMHSMVEDQEFYTKKAKDLVVDANKVGEALCQVVSNLLHIVMDGYEDLDPSDKTLNGSLEEIAKHHKNVEYLTSKLDEFKDRVNEQLKDSQTLKEKIGKLQGTITTLKGKVQSLEKLQVDWDKEKQELNARLEKLNSSRTDDSIIQQYLASKEYQDQRCLDQVPVLAYGINKGLQFALKAFERLAPDVSKEEFERLFHEEDQKEQVAAAREREMLNPSEDSDDEGNSD